MRCLTLLFAPLLFTALFGAACSKTTPHAKAASEIADAAADVALPVVSTRRIAAFASLPDRGNLLGYPAQRVERQELASTWYRADISEEHALHSVVTGEMTVSAPDGQPIRLRYQRHVEHPNGNWTWIGRDEHGEEAIVTFGEKAVFGSIPRHGGEELRLTTSRGRSWVVEADASKQHHPDPKRPDYVVPPELAQSFVSNGPVTASASMEAVTPAAVGTTVDIALGYTAGFASELGGDSQAVTRLQNLVDVTNQAYSNSQISAQIRLVRTVAVNYPDATDNNDVLAKLSGYQSGSGSIPVDPAFGALRAARDQYGADLVSLVRRFRTPENKGCGVAWLIGGDQSRIDNSDAPWGYSVVSDDLDRGDLDETDNKTYVCRKETLAHEMGHNMGQAHNSEDSDGTSGAHSYSYGYREASSTGFYTVMAYRLPDSSQRAIRYFANPNVPDASTGRPTGTVNADNARSMIQTLPLVAAFRASVVQEPAVSYPGSLVGMGGKCLDVRGGSTSNGAPIQVWACNGLRQQAWTPRSTTGALLSMGTNSALDVVGFGTGNGTILQLWSALGNANQAWYFAQSAIVANGGRVLDAVGASSANGTRMQLWDDLDGANQRWVFDISTGQIIGKDGKCLDVVGFGTANGTPVQFWTCSSTPNQQWSWGSGGTIRGYGGKCLEAANGGTTNGTQVRMWDCNGSAHQTWRVRGEVRSVMTGKCLDDPYSGTSNGTQVHMWDCHGGANQKWEYSSL
jgi:hypothetical protein